jgi:hypothetical protein
MIFSGKDGWAFILMYVAQKCAAVLGASKTTAKGCRANLSFARHPLARE